MGRHDHVFFLKEHKAKEKGQSMYNGHFSRQWIENRKIPVIAVSFGADAFYRFGAVGVGFSANVSIHIELGKQ